MARRETGARAEAVEQRLAVSMVAGCVLLRGEEGEERILARMRGLDRARARDIWRAQKKHWSDDFSVCVRELWQRESLRARS